MNWYRNQRKSVECHVLLIRRGKYENGNPFTILSSIGPDENFISDNNIVVFSFFFFYKNLQHLARKLLLTRVGYIFLLLMFERPHSQASLSSLDAVLLQVKVIIECWKS